MVYTSIAIFNAKFIHFEVLTTKITLQNLLNYHYYNQFSYKMY